VLAGGSLAFLQSIYRNPGVPLSVRMRAAIEALPFETPKLSATAIIPGGEHFAARLERAIERSRQGLRLIEHSPDTVKDGPEARDRNSVRATADCLLPERQGYLSPACHK
jgi:hypothetical protein